MASPQEDVVYRNKLLRRKASCDYRESVFNVICDDDNNSLSGAELFDSSWSDSDSFNDVRDVEKTNDENAQPSDEIPAQKEHNDNVNDKPRKIAEELLKTEHDYVTRLYLLHQVFYLRLDKENKQQQMFPPDVLNQMFLNTRSIYLFHHDFLLPQLENRMKHWSCDPRIGDLMKQNAPFLKMYSEYTRNFDQAMKLINYWMEKSSRFLNIIKQIQKLPECGSLSLQHHMLGPIQRVPRYELLLKDYVKHLPAFSPDLSDANDALELVTKASSHSNEALKKIEKFRQLLDLYQNLKGVAVDFISPTRELIASGPITKISARTGERQQRQMFLFSDMMLICTQHMRYSFSIRCQLDMESTEINSSCNAAIPDSFTLLSKQKTVNLLDENHSREQYGWEEKIKMAICAHKERKKTIKLEEEEENSQEKENIRESYLGKTAPTWMQDDAVSTCVACDANFSVFRRRHHCRACGKLICKSCCKKAPLEYKAGKIERVCPKCHHVIVHKKSSSRPDSTCRDCKKKVSFEK